MTRAGAAPDPAACPLCGGGNACAMAADAGAAAAALRAEPCWCTHATFAPALLERVPAAARGRPCICARCAQADPAAPPFRSASPA